MLGISPDAAGAFVSYLALGMVIGKVGWGMLSDRFGRVAVVLTILVLAVIALLVLWQAGSYLPVVGGVFVVGLCYGGFLALIGPVTLDAFGPRHFPVNFGVMFLSVAVAAYAGPRLAAAVAEANDGAYKQAFLVAAVMTLVALVLAAVYALIARRRPTSPAHTVVADGRGIDG
jgi:OFA family oxalate/formate antiporter-like MFS transporter